MRQVADPIKHLSGSEADRFAKLVARDSNGMITVLRDGSGALVSRYTKEHAQEEFRVNPPHLIADQAGRLLVAKKYSPEQFVHQSDEGPVPLHPADEISGSLLLSAIGAPGYSAMARGRDYEYFGFIPGIDLLSAKENGLLEEVAGNQEWREKLFFGIGIALAHAYIIGARDRFGGIRFDLLALESAAISEVKAGSKVVCQNIDLSSSLDQRVFDRGFPGFWNAFSFFTPGPFKREGRSFTLNETIMRGFLSGYEMAQAYFRQNEGHSADLIRREAGEKSALIFHNLALPISLVEKAVEGYQARK
ncbi:hypothetical protein A3K48_04245 [candidate division WOR-1 bacterium RIFOXYA12_FULL_52_29]|uniref:Uncharacterized protein n=1 Tax=candidate division WOR-1 bacterium RIFOXYC12_FULL_54_18 TaxID=1802584 RepID=A0A1F4T6N2_UNCSA|nr:MAG: hypothetical protein A3K44_04245 [candidate division WOR-1 bacterium RIFOXYA2_FULL_51_19]OGC17762.1 MAG: hypothetical protein A3K48_04245 [candidate division WOR-1 bacterium RIFOXYA12_FULL_52_29]OGC26619.1 MAG: hypothetical protein A3K32_04240 [candidate division WOR-1 bacterium RIFOXYB2_FULL_45_9]OGC28179.1 MAG: hypothetical protein A3K49_04245 [candidate division WOR-1 bacterium RIFOXYC12_FULL_54_18]OGC29534.1 MAG: hypothetical protein A2346_02090 [candidate division WOR-1 bacterium R